MSFTSVAGSALGSSAGVERTTTWAGPARPSSSPRSREEFGVRLGFVGVGHGDVDRDRHEQRLCRHPVGLQRCLQPFVGRALVRSVHVDQHEPALRLREDVHTVQLRNCIPEGVLDRMRGDLGSGGCTVPHFVERPVEIRGGHARSADSG